MKNRLKRAIALLMTGIFSLVFVISCSTKVNFLSRGGFSEAQEPKSSFRGSIARFVSRVRPHQGNPDSHYLLACYYQDGGEHKKAVEEFEKVLLIEPKHVQAHNGMGVSFDQMKEYSRAVESYQRALRLNPDLDHVLNNLGYSYLLQGLPDEAIPALQKAIALNGTEERFHNNLGLAYAVKGEIDLALAEFKLAGEESRAHFNIARFYHQRGLYRIAQFHYSQALRLDPSFSHARLASEAIHTLARIFQPAEEPKETPLDLSSPSAGRLGRNSLHGSTGSPRTDQRILKINYLTVRHELVEGRTADYDTVSGGPEEMPIPEKEAALKEFAAETSSQDQGNNSPAPARTEATPSFTEENLLQEEGMTGEHDDTGRRDNDPAQVSAPPVVPKMEAVSPKDPAQPAGRKPVLAKAVSIEVSNGNGVNGMARRVSQYLKDKGLPVSRITNADHFNHRRTMIYYRDGYHDAAVEVADQIPGLQDMEEQKRFDRAYINVKVVIGKDILSDKVLKGRGKS